jgi:hypothetical protein
MLRMPITRTRTRSSKPIVVSSHPTAAPQKIPTTVEPPATKMNRMTSSAQPIMPPPARRFRRNDSSV